MATFTVTLPADKLAGFIAAYSEGYSPTLIDGSPNPVTRTTYAKMQLALEMRDKYSNYMRRQYALPNFDDSNLTVD
jgi:hypothetical protein